MAGHRLLAPALLLLPALAPAQTAAPRTDANSQAAHLELLEKARRGGIDLYFEGDSITRRWGASDPQYKDFLDNWTRNFFGWNAANFGWGGDTTKNILWRLQNGEMDGVHPKVIVLLAGTNDLPNTPPAEIAAGIRAIVDVMLRKAPGAFIILTGILPRNDRNGMALMPAINEVNARIAGLANGNQIRFLNINSRLAGPDGRLLEGMTVDRLHLSGRGYQVWADALKPMLRALLGPPAATDHAPPPTGDPSQQKPAGSRR